jgi:hypothetical protein
MVAETQVHRSWTRSSYGSNHSVRCIRQPLTVYLTAGATDMRKGFDGSAPLV